MNLTVARYQPGQPLYSDFPDSQGLKPVFGFFSNSDNSLTHQCMERADTMIPEGTYKYSLYFSPANKCVVLLLHDVPGFEMIEHHIANWPHELKGCTAHGMGIIAGQAMLTGSGIAFGAMMQVIKEENPNAKLSVIGTDGKIIPGDILGEITYCKFQMAA